MKYIFKVLFICLLLIPGCFLVAFPDKAYAGYWVDLGDGVSGDEYSSRGAYFNNGILYSGSRFYDSGDEDYYYEVSIRNGDNVSSYSKILYSRSNCSVVGLANYSNGRIYITTRHTSSGDYTYHAVDSLLNGSFFEVMGSTIYTYVTRPVILSDGRICIGVHSSISDKNWLRFYTGSHSYSETILPEEFGNINDIYASNDGFLYIDCYSKFFKYKSNSEYTEISGLPDVSKSQFGFTHKVFPHGLVYDSLNGDRLTWKGKSGYGFSVDSDGNIWYGTRYKYVADFSVEPSYDGETGNLVINPKFCGESIVNAVIQYSTDGVTFQDLYTSKNGSTYTLKPTADNYWFRMKWYWSPNATVPTQVKYTNSVKVPTIPQKPVVSNTTSVVQWDKVKGRSKVVLNWTKHPSAKGYNLKVFDGYKYRKYNIGNVSSWDSSAAKIFPYPADLPENNSINTDVFRWDKSGLDFEDTSVRLYRSTSGTNYDSTNRYYFELTAYNDYMETEYTRFSVILPNATDATPPGGSVTIASVDEPNNRVTLDLSSIYDNQSGLDQIRFSSDGSSYSSWGSFVTSKIYSVPSGDGTKTVFVQVRDKVGNINTFSDSCFFGVTTTQLYNAIQEIKSYINSAKSAAEQAKAASDEARDSANAAAYRAIEAWDSANSAKQSADTAVGQTFYNGTYGGSNESVADIAGYMQNTQLPGIATDANTAAANTTYNGKSAAEWAAEAAQTTSSDAIYTVTANKPYMLIIEGEYGSNAGTLCSATDVKSGKTGTDAVLATSPAGSGVTIIESNPDYNNGNGFSSAGIKKVTIGSKTIYINTVAPPTAGTVTVTF